MLAGQPTSLAYDKDFIVSSLDLLSGLAEGLGSRLQALVAPGLLREILLECCKDDTPDVRQGAFALTGDLARGWPQSILISGKEFCELAVQAMQPDMVCPENVSSCNNACWCLGEISLKVISPLEEAAYSLIICFYLAWCIVNQ